MIDIIYVFNNNNNTVTTFKYTDFKIYEQVF